MTEALRLLFEYNAWSDKRLLAHLREIERPPARVMQLLSHLLVAENVWLSRLNGIVPPFADLWETLSLARCEELAAASEKGFARYLAEHSAAKLTQPITYKTTKGVEWRTPPFEILLQVTHHGAYHRGQVAAELQGANVAAVNTDFITFSRERDRTA